VAYPDLTIPAHAYFFGFAQTDGNHYAGTRQRGRLTIELSERDDAVLHSFTGLFDVHARVSYRERITNFGKHRSATWTVCDLAFRRELVELGLPTGPKSSTVAPPVTAFSARDYMRGLIDGDGSVGFSSTGRPFVGFATASQSLAEFFCAQSLDVVGAHRTPRRNTRDGIYNLVVAGDPAAPLAAWLYPDGCLALERKRRAAAFVAEWTRPTGMRARPVAGSRRWTAAEDADVFTGSIEEAATRLGRSEKSVALRRFRLRQATQVPAAHAPAGERAGRLTGTVPIL
jgi:LAGLIDADG-like domain